MFSDPVFGLGLLGFLYVWQLDWTQGGRNTLSPASQSLLSRLAGPVRLTVFARPDSALRGAIEILIGRYQRYKPDIALGFVNPDTTPHRHEHWVSSGKGNFRWNTRGGASGLPG